MSISRKRRKAEFSSSETAFVAATADADLSMLPPNSDRKGDPTYNDTIGAALMAVPAISLVRAFDGRFDGINNDVAEGWAHWIGGPDEPARVELWAHGILQAVGLADLYRQDLADSGIQQGNCSFKIPLPQNLISEQFYNFTVKIAGSGKDLAGGPITYFVKEKTITVRLLELSGTVFECDIVALKNWGGGLNLLIDGVVVGSVDLGTFLPGDSRTFEIPLPLSAFDGRVAWIRLADAVTGVVLADAAAQLPTVSTPEDALRSYARDFPGFMSAVAGRRHESLRRQFSIAGMSGQAMSAQACAQIGRAYNAVLAGFNSKDLLRGELVFPVVENPTVSVVIPVHNKFEVTYNCLASLLLAPNKASFEVIIVDDGSTDRTVELASLVSGVTVLRNAESIGFVRSCNKGAAAMRGQYVMMLNNDTEVTSCWLDELLHIFQIFQEAGLVGSKLIYPDGKLQEAGGFIFRDQCWNYGRGQNPNDPKYNYTRKTDYISGAAIMLPRTLWEELRGFSDIFAPAYYEDTDLAMRVRQSGREVYYCPFSEVIHFEGQSNGVSVTGGGIKRYQLVNEKKFRARWAQELLHRPPTPDVKAAKDPSSLFRVLVIDAETPRPDNNAGSYAALQEMRLLQSLGGKLTFLPENLAYLGHYTEALQRSGIECVYAPYCSSITSFVAERGQEFDVIYITRYHVARRYIDIIRREAPQARIIFCNADLHFLREIRAALVENNPAAMSTAIDTRDAELEVMRKVNVTLSYTDAEAAVILSHNLGSGRVMRCPWVVDAEGSQAGFAARHDIAFLGGFGHPPNLDAVIFFIDEVMPRLRSALPGVRFMVYGAGIPDALRRRAAGDVVLAGYVANVAEVYDTCRVFVAPLRSGAGIKGKVIGALAAGVPTVLSTVAAEGTGIAQGREAFVAESASEWVEAICLLYTDEARWAAMSESAAGFARSQYSFASGRKLMRAALAAVDVYTPEV
jgi:GT2 family glycosyltransferase